MHFTRKHGLALAFLALLGVAASRPAQAQAFLFR